MIEPTPRHARWMLVLVLISTACSRGKCTDRPKPEPAPPPPGPAGERQLTVEGYEALVYGPGPKASFADTSSIEHEAIAKLIPRMLEGAQAASPPDPRAWQADAAAAGLQIEVWKLDGRTYWALVEPSDRVRGVGAYVFRVAPPEAGPMILLQAPHEFFDLGTGRIAAELFFDPPRGATARPRALFTNTIHRYQLAPGNKQKRRHNPADVAHNPQHAFSVATEAFASAAGGARVIQIHGFGARTDDDDGGEPGSVAMVVSAGDEAGSSPLTAALAQALAGEYGPDVKRFPEDVRFLGATTNVQGRLLRRIEGSEFVHLEMSSELRKKLRASAQLRRRLGEILFNTQPARKGS